ncbi:MAG: B12-binding domain-containing radical SAM protein [Desulfamplus sp.]|nr:B12-binding domain-containing radical SAM protein [Desulfamplus sp.]
MKILLINPSGWQKDSVNLGLAYLAASLKQAGYPTLILDLNRNEMNDWYLMQTAKDYAPLLIGISVKTATANEGGRIANMLSQEIPETLLLAGGPHITISAESYMKAFPAFHYAVMGEGEQSIVELVKTIAADKPVDAIRGLVFRKGGQDIINNWSPPENLDDLPLPDLDSIEGFNWNGFRYPIVTSRGCPFQCTYCCVNKLTGSRKWRSRSAENVLDELEYIVRKKGISAFEIWDDNFTLNINRAKEICRGLIQRKLNLSWYCHNGIRADRIDSELAHLMKQAGCTSIAFGIESGNVETFDSIKKGEPLSAVVRAVKIVKKTGIKAIGYFIIGLPGDNLERFIETIRFQRSLKLDNYIFGMLIPYPKTEVWDVVQNSGKMFCDITRTQHFSSDIVPISFELPGFPKQDMIRAFYIARYFSLYDAVQKIINRGETPFVAYHMSQEIETSLAGMIIACDPHTKHFIIGIADTNKVFELPSFAQLPKGLSIRFQLVFSKQLLNSVQIIVSYQGLMEKGVVVSNTSLLVVEPSIPLIIEVKKRIQLPFPMPELILSVFGVVTALPNVFRELGVIKLSEIIARRIHDRYPQLIDRLRPILISQNINLGDRNLIRKMFYSICKLPQWALSIPWQIYQYAQTKKKLKNLNPEKKVFPYDDYPSYM